MVDLILANVVDQDRAKNAACGPGRQQPSVYAADIARSEQIGQIGRKSRETATVQPEDNDVQQTEKRHVTRRTNTWNKEEHNGASGTDDIVHIFKAQILRLPRHEKKAEHAHT